MNKISQNKDFELSSTKNGIVNQIIQEQKNYLNYPEDKSFSDLNFIHLEKKSNEFNYEIDNDYSINSLEDDLHSSKKSEFEFDLFSKNIVINEYMENDMNKLLKDNIPLPPIKKYDIIEESNNQIHLTTYGDYKDDQEQSEKDENELTNQNSGIFNKIQNRKMNKIRKKLKFLILEEKKQSKVSTQMEKEKGKTSDTPDIISLKELFEKNINKKYKYKCEHSGCTKTFRTLKLKLNRHDLSDINCKKDTITLLYMVNNVKKLLKREKRKNSTRINRLQKLYKKCIYSLPHKDYAINIAGNHLIN